MARTVRRAGRRGFTLIEMVLSVTLMLIVFAMAVPFFRAQARAVDQTARRLDALAGGRYGASSLDREVRVAGVNTPAAQPVLVQAAADAITINGDFVAPDTSDALAVYVNPDADRETTSALTARTRVTLPNSAGWTYPDTAYQDDSGNPSLAETVSYWVAPDPERSGEAALFRRANRGEPRVVVRGVVATGAPVFRYFYVAPDGRLTEVAAARLPLRHAVPMHGDAADTGSAGFIDTVRVVRVRLQTVARDARTGRADTLSQESSIRVMNAGLLKRTSCGAVPRTPAFAADPAPSVVGGATVVDLAVLPSADEGDGERDVMRYALYRRPASEPDWGEPIASVVASGAASYAVQDRGALSGVRYVYGVAAMDCTPRLSEIAVSRPVDAP